MEPVRTCLGCRRREPRSSLVRVVVRDGAVVVDTRARLAGRGAWVHGTLDCIGTATARRAWARALRSAHPLDTTGIMTNFGSTGSDERKG